MIKLFLSDLDGTLIDEYGTMQPEDQAAIYRLADHHIAFAIVTGRDVGFCRRLSSRYQLPKCDIVANNGASILIDDQKIAEASISAAATIEIMEFMQDHLDELNPFICDERNRFYFMLNHYEPQQWTKAHQLLSYLGDISTIDLLDYLNQSNEPAVKISIHTYTQPNTDKWLPILRKQFSDRYEILPTSADFIEITQKGTNKGKAVDMILKRLNIKPDEVAVIGDGENDISLFQAIPLSFAMQSAKETVRQSAAKVVKSVAEAVAFVIEYATDPLNQ